MKEILLTIKPSDSGGGSGGGASTEYTFYKDGTYSCDHWNPGVLSKWKLDAGSLWVKHSINQQNTLKNEIWQECKRVEMYHYDELYRAIEIALVERILLG